jgi:phosphoglycerate kinase
MPDLSTIDVAGKRVFLRCDLNVPLKEGVIKDDGRIKASLPTIQTLLEKGASLVIAAHLGRPKGEAKPELSLAPVAKRLSELLGREVKFTGQLTGEAVTQEAQSLQAGEILMLVMALAQFTVSTPLSLIFQSYCHTPQEPWLQQRLRFSRN